jgi:hypothetical protein
MKIKSVFLILLVISNVIWAKNGDLVNNTIVNEDRMTLSATDEDNIVTAQPYLMTTYDESINQFYNMLASKHSAPLSLALTFFLNAPYFLEPLGEGMEGKYSQEPVYRTDQFDCVAYVDMVLALIHSNNLQQFQANIRAIRYDQGKVDYIYRTDWFTDLEWLPNAQRLGWIKDVTVQIVDKEGRSIALIAETTIDKPNWYKVKPLKVMHLLPPLPESQESNCLLDQLKSHGDQFQARASRLPYLPLNKLFNKDGSANNDYFEQIPTGSVIAIVRPDWNIRDTFPGFPQGYGTNLNVSHLGIVVRDERGLMFYNASSLHGKVEAEPLTVYLQKYIDSPTIKGIHVERII